ncbi:unnamed protein product [Rotaria magnacalcarata]|uniref:U-box domain-containing protein n=1 Tax=Rotaria magnacalcarata TaxID=392030 RepID=A0A816UUG4_9BILA|nr:unnamed protein product [Rotaria magnacalcarata]CAF2113303.1 unnamed protein product [Rotaria magnacalcarata]CAF3827226.1 unnamed protein product [Rotaria magnacalcarata]CAF3975012.1 unnamed protein product [Rotaria magnacalcarata]
MSTCVNSAVETFSPIEEVTNAARQNVDWGKVYQHIFLNPRDFFVILPNRRWSIAHQTVLHGDVDRFKRFIVLFSNDEVDIRIKTRDNKTFLDIATSKRQDHPEMYTYIEHLSMQDDLMKKAKDCDWRSVIEILEQRKQLANEKPPYSPYFLLHYAVEDGNLHILEELLTNYQCFTNVRNHLNETPLEMAKRLNKNDICALLERKTATEQPAHSPAASSQVKLHSIYQQSTSNSPDLAENSSVAFQPLPSPPATTRPNQTLIGFDKIRISIDSLLQSEQNLTNLCDTQPLVSSQRPDPPRSRPKKSIVRDCSPSVFNPVPPVIMSTSFNENLKPPSADVTSASLCTKANSSNEQLMKKLKCPITGKIMNHPVIASDGNTYERANIIDWINTYGYSPETGEPMEATFKDDNEIKKILHAQLKRT